MENSRASAWAADWQARCRLYRVNDGGHRMPGSFPDARFPRLANALLGAQNRDIDGAETISGFFRQFQ